MRPCTPLTFAPAPRESAIKPVPHPAAPVGEPSQTRRHPLMPPPYSNFACTCRSATKGVLLECALGQAVIAAESPYVGPIKKRLAFRPAASYFLAGKISQLR